ncbi:RNA polymerase beta subunit chloroplast [Cinnamomum micranthum f. kanehirae]|uniref:RNA polymerase beta subunit chloroplast n=1 Tax=Cinnamomum micranthum f. kanehirae TaxID=337451 RepID=A0A3S4NLB3_9MAGN|nr:RNA polymerase beta subunit chloroplast [Cinnamomum micranthum f. kanehirae]
MDVPAGIMHLLHNNPLGEGPSKGDNEYAKWKVGLYRDLVLLIFHKRCLLINRILLELVRKYVELQLLDEQYLNPIEDAPKSFRLLVRELRSLALELNHFLVFEKNFQINRKEA